MLVAEVPRLRGIALAEHDVSDDVEPGFAPGGHERIHFVPTIERHAQAVGPEHAVHLPESRFQPGVVVVIRYAAAGAVAVVHKVRRIGKDEIDARPWHGAHDIDAVTAGYAVQHTAEKGVAHGWPPHSAVISERSLRPYFSPNQSAKSSGVWPSSWAAAIRSASMPASPVSMAKSFSMAASTASQ